MALQLDAFTMPQLAEHSGVSYETVKRVLRTQEGNTMRRTGEKVTQAIGRPADVWEVTDKTSIEQRLGAANEVLREFDRGAALPEDAAAIQPADRSLAHAEDELVFALNADDPDDAAAFAVTALATLEEAGIDVQAQPPAVNGLAEKRNLPIRQARGAIVKHVAEYIRSAESIGFAGPLWRQAFGAVASVELPEQTSLQRRFLIDLVRIVDERAFAHGIQALPQSEIVDLIVRTVSDDPEVPSSDEMIAVFRRDTQAGREAMRRALALLVADIAAREGYLNPKATENLLRVTSAAFAPGFEASGDVLETLVDALCTLAVNTDAALARRAQETLLAIHEPRRPSFWHGLLHSRLASNRIAFVALSRISLDEAFDYLRTALNRTASLEEVSTALCEGLPEIAEEAHVALQERFAEFLATIPGAQRDQLIGVPALAGLDWPAPRFEQFLARNLFGMLARWLAFARSDHDDDRVLGMRHRLESEIKRVAIEVFSLLSDGEQRRLSHLLVREVYQPPTAALCVPVLLDLGLEADLARSLTDATNDDEEAWASIMNWYLNVCPRGDLSPSHRIALFNSLSAALEDGSSFVIGLAQRTAGSREKFYELTENPALTSPFKARLEMKMTDSYADVAQELADVAAAYTGGL